MGRIQSSDRQRKSRVARAGVESSPEQEDPDSARLLRELVEAVDPDRRNGSRLELPVGCGLARLSRAEPECIGAALQIGTRAASVLAKAFALGRRVEAERADDGRAMHSAEQVWQLMCPVLRGLSRESFHVLLLDGKHRLLRRLRISEGTLTTSLVHPREVFRPAILTPSAALIAVHNHPSGDPEPSAEDLAVTRRLVSAGRLLGIPLIDHVVVAQKGYVSLRERVDFQSVDFQSIELGSEK